MWAYAGGLEDEEFLGPVVLRINHCESDGFLEAAARDARDGFGVAQNGRRCQLGLATLAFRRRETMFLMPLARGPTLQKRRPTFSSAEL